MMLVDRISKEKLLENLEATFGYDFHRSIYPQIRNYAPNMIQKRK